MKKVDSKERSLVGGVDDVDLAAFLVAVGFPITGGKVVKRHDLSSQGHAGVDKGVWEFTRVSADGTLRFEQMMDWWSKAMKNAPGTPRMLFAARMAVHNLHCLTALVNGAPLSAMSLGDHTRLINQASVSGGVSVPCAAALEAPAVLVSNTDACAVALSLGCRLVSYHCLPTGISWGLTRGVSEYEPGAVETHRRELEWVQAKGNMSPLAVAIATLENRRRLITGARRRQEMHLVRSGGDLLYLPACADDTLLEQGARLMNI